MKFKAPIAMNISGFGIGIMGFIMPTYIEFIKPCAIYLLVLGMCFIVIPWLFIGLVFFKNKRKKPMVTSERPNTASYFPRLNEARLREFAERLVNKYPQLPIRTITLYRYHSENPQTKAIYAMVIEVAETVKSSPELMKTFNELQSTTGFLIANPEPNSARELGIDASFREVYRGNPPDIFLEEWEFFLKTTDEYMPNHVMTDEKSLLLYQSTT